MRSSRESSPATIQSRREIDGRIDLQPYLFLRECGRKFLNGALCGRADIRGARRAFRRCLLAGEIGGKCLEDAANHLFLAIRFALARLDHAA